MADNYPTLASMVLINDQNISDIFVTDLLNDAPFLAALFAQGASNGTNHSYLKWTAKPDVAFRDVNDGREHDHSTDVNVPVALKILDASFTADYALANSYTKGGASAYIAREAGRSLQQAFFHAERQLLNIQSGQDAKGFPGLADSADMDALADTLHVVNAGGAATCESVYLIRSAENGVSAVLGEDGRLTMGDTVVQRIAGSTTGWLPAYFTPITGWMALQLGSAFDAVRIANLKDDASNGLDDDLIAAAIALFPAGRQPTHIVMSRRQLRRLQNSRTATNSTGAPAPFPQEAFGIPIIVTDGIETHTAIS